MGIDIVGNRNGWWRVAQYWWPMFAEYSHHIAPTITASCRYWYTSDEDGLNANQARQLGAALQRSVDDCRIDAYARQLFARVCNEKDVPSFARFYDEFELFDCQELPSGQKERRFVDEFVSEVLRFIEFLHSCEGFRIL